MEIFNSKTKVFEYPQHYNGTPEQVFPLLCYKREYEWIPGWNCKQIYSKSGVMEKGCVFVSYLQNLDHWSHLKQALEMYWYVSVHDAENYYIEAVDYVNDLFVLKFSIKLIDEGNGKTTAVFRHEYTGLNEDGNVFVEKVMTEELYNSQQQFLEKCMNHFLDTGKMIKLQ